MCTKHSPTASQKIPHWCGTHYLVGGILWRAIIFAAISSQQSESREKRISRSICHCFCFKSSKQQPSLPPLASEAAGTQPLWVPNGENPTTGKSFVITLFALSSSCLFSYFAPQFLSKAFLSSEECGNDPGRYLPHSFEKCGFSPNSLLFEEVSWLTLIDLIKDHTECRH